MACNCNNSYANGGGGIASNGSSGLITPPSLQPINSWIDLQRTCPKDPLQLIAYAKLGTTVGVPRNSTTFNSASGGWAATALTLNSTPLCKANGTDNYQKVAEADQWNYSHITSDTDSTMAIPMRKLLFLRAGTDWNMQFDINFGGSTYIDTQLSLRNNAGTRGDAQGTIPVISFSDGSFTGVVTMYLTLRFPASVWMGLVSKVSGSTSNMFEMDWEIVL